MQSMQKAQMTSAPEPQQVKLYFVDYTSVQVYECTVKDITVMRRCTDSYVNATQILKVAGLEKSRRTRILEKVAASGDYQITQGGHRKCQGTWVPLEKGRSIATQHYVVHLLAPLFDFVPSSSSLSGLPTTGGMIRRPPFVSSSFASLGDPSGFSPPTLPSTPIPPGSALHLLHQGRAQGLFTPASSSIRPLDLVSKYSTSTPSTPPLSLKRTHSEVVDNTPISFSIKCARTETDKQYSSVSQPMSQSNNTMPPPPLPSSCIHHPCRLSTKPSTIRPTSPTAPLMDPTRQAVVAVLHERDDPAHLLKVLDEISPDYPGASVFDCVLDDLGHTALHIAASMGRQKTVEMLISNGTDLHRGNFNGETPLIRACLAPNHYEEHFFTALVASLHESIWTLDTSRKSVLHHIVALSGVENRAIVAQEYLDTILLWIAREKGGDFRSIVDVQDEHGDTALNVAVRVGIRRIVRLLLDVGASPVLPNNLGIRPGDFWVGAENEDLNSGLRVENPIASVGSGSSASVRKSQEVISGMTTMIQNLSAGFSSELKTVQDKLDVMRAQIRAATRKLSEERKEIQAWQSQCTELDKIKQRIHNIEKALEDVDSFDWTGRSDLADNDAKSTAGPAFMWHGANSTMVGLDGSTNDPINWETDPPMPLSDSVQSLIKLKRLRMWQVRTEELFRERMKNSQGTSVEKEFQYKKIVALCTGKPVDQVEEMLDDLIIAMEGEAHATDATSLIQKAGDGLI